MIKVYGMPNCPYCAYIDSFAHANYISWSTNPHTNSFACDTFVAVARYNKT